MSSPMDTRSWSAVLVIDRSACRLGGGTIVTQATDVLLLDGSRSSWLPVTEAVLQTWVVPDGVFTVPTIVTTTLSDPSGRTLPWIVQSTTLPARLQESEGVDFLLTSAETKSTPDGSASWIRICVPGRGPLLVTVRV